MSSIQIPQAQEPCLIHLYVTQTLDGASLQLLGEIHLVFQNSTFKNPPNLYRCMKGVNFFELIFPLGSTSSHSVMVPQHIDSDVTLISSSVSSGKQKYTKFKHMINCVSGVDCPEELTWVGRLMVMTCRVQYTMFYILFKKSPYIFQL